MTRELFLTALVVTTMIPAAVAALADWRAHRVPNSLVILTLAPAVLAVALADEPATRLVASAVGAGVMALPVLLVHLVSPAAMGFGDVKLAVALGAALGLIAPVLAVPALAAGAGLTLLVACCRRRVAVPFAPGLVAGAVAAVALGSLEGWKVAV
jgi:leader peptidase (prepilin peptidase)/N-methyltransferase